LLQLSYRIENIINEDHLQIKQLIYNKVEVSSFDLDILSPVDRLKFDSFLSEKRRSEFYFTRVLLLDFETEIQIRYKPSGKPVINDGHISVSHSKNIIIIGFSTEHNLGVDIEFMKEKIHRIKHKFLAPFELRTFNTNDLNILTIIWSIKEAVYKLEDIEGLRFKDDMVVNLIGEEGLISVQKYGISHDYLFNCLVFNDYIITYCHLKD
jgi:phosphopantetheinyl transferase (holo-ACP synthase)